MSTWLENHKNEEFVSFGKWSFHVLVKYRSETMYGAYGLYRILKLTPQPPRAPKRSLKGTMSGISLVTVSLHRKDGGLPDFGLFARLVQCIYQLTSDCVVDPYTK